MKLEEKKKALQLDLLQAANDGDIQGMRQCIEEGADVNQLIGPVRKYFNVCVFNIPYCYPCMYLER